ncbi:MAG: T9SS type A sorting domain-containing protein, partial [Ignavibacteriaceae bacterium]|nr:T9SS type A sorting domain-containing protein [Ignavibacteriaceae bacterium]
SKELKGCVINGTVYGDTTKVGVEDKVDPVATTFNLEQNYPNPFNPSTKIKYTIPVVETRHASSLQFVTLKVYDILGNEIATLVNEEKPAGEYEVEFHTSSIQHHPASGIYFYQLKAGSFVETKKMILLK